MKKIPVEITIFNIQKKVFLSKAWAKKVVLQTARKLKGSGELNIVFTDNVHIKALNKKYRRKNYITDVLSFRQDKKRSTLLLGDIVISAERAKQQAEEYGSTFKEEIARLISHGILHLLGYTHKEMKRKFGSLAI